MIRLKHVKTLGQARVERDKLGKEVVILDRVVHLKLARKEMLGEITKLQLNRIKKRVQQAHGVPFEYTDAVVEEIVNRCQELDSGGRMIDAIVTNTMLPDISAEFLKRMMEGQEVSKVVIDVTDGDFTYGFD